jgi:hypothetical protein
MPVEQFMAFGDYFMFEVERHGSSADYVESQVWEWVNLKRWLGCQRLEKDHRKCSLCLARFRN